MTRLTKEIQAWRVGLALPGPVGSVIQPPTSVAPRGDSGKGGLPPFARDNQTDVDYLRHGGVLPMVLRDLMTST